MTQPSKRPWRVGWWAHQRRPDRTEWYVFKPPPDGDVRDDVCFREIHRAEYGEEHYCSKHCDQDTMVVGTTGEYSETVLSMTLEDAKHIVHCVNNYDRLLEALRRFVDDATLRLSPDSTPGFLSRLAAGKAAIAQATGEEVNHVVPTPR